MLEGKKSKINIKVNLIMKLCEKFTMNVTNNLANPNLNNNDLFKEIQRYLKLNLELTLINDILKVCIEDIDNKIKTQNKETIASEILQFRFLSYTLLILEALSSEPSQALQSISKDLEYNKL